MVFKNVQNNESDILFMRATGYQCPAQSNSLKKEKVIVLFVYRQITISSILFGIKLF